MVAICLGALASFFVYTQAVGRQSVVVVQHAVARGAVIGRGDLTVTEIGGAAGVQTVPANQLGTLVGTRTAVDLSAGSLLTPAAVAAAPVPATARSVVGIRLADGRAPLRHLLPGSPVRLVAVPPDGAEAGFSDAYDDTAVVAEVVDVTPGTDGQSVVLDVDVAEADAPTVARLAAANRLSAVRDAEG